MKLQICEYSSRKAKTGKNIAVGWDAFVEKLSRPTITHETTSEFYRFDRDRQSEIKDVGGFIAGYTKEGRRGKAYIETRSMIVLDADFAGEDFRERLDQTVAGYEYFYYPTHKSRKGERRYRLIFPLNRDITPEEYEPIARYLTHEIGMERFDATTYQPERLMFYPSISSDAEYDCHNATGMLVDPDIILETKYRDWRNVSEWPVSKAESDTFAKQIDRKIKKQNPLEKTGTIGAFCRSYTISEAISEFLPDVYSETESPNRYTYSNGTTSGGLVVYSDDLFAYSHHSTDPANGELHNVFDLVRIHKFGDLDEGKDGKGETLPSYKAMKEFIVSLPKVKREIISSKIDAYDEFKDDLEEAEATEKTDKKWSDLLEVSSKTGELKATAKNVKLILENDLAFKDKLAKDLMISRPVKLGWMPWDREDEMSKSWKDEDDASLRNYLEEKYSIHARDRISDALSEIFAKHAFHPVRDYLNSLVWDGKERLDNLLIDYMGADNSEPEYLKAVTRKAFTACVKRVFQPGCKYDYVLLLVGKQGKGKSHFLKVMGGDWFSDTLTTIGGKESYEALDGSWIIEMAEMTAAKKADIEAMKQFITKQSDKYRKAYDRRVTDNPRQCAFFGTTNERECLRDYTGNRRYWIVDVFENENIKNQFTELEEERDQIWAEAVYRYKQGEVLYLPPELEEVAKRIQDEHTFRSTRWSDIRNYLERKVPNDWNDMDRLERVNWLENNSEDDGDYVRDTICTKEIWLECCEGSPNRPFPTSDQRDIGACLDFLGWVRESKNTRVKGYGQQKVFKRKGK